MRHSSPPWISLSLSLCLAALPSACVLDLGSEQGLDSLEHSPCGPLDGGVAPDGGAALPDATPAHDGGPAPGWGAHDGGPGPGAHDGGPSASADGGGGDLGDLFDVVPCPDGGAIDHDGGAIDHDGGAIDHDGGSAAYPDASPAQDDGCAGCAAPDAAVS